MPYTDGSIGSNVRDSGEQSSGLKKSSSGKGLKKLTKQSTVESEKRREMLKQESKDSGIVTEMVVRPKDVPMPVSQRELQRSESTGTSSSSKNRRSLKSKGQSDKIKRSQSVKVKGHKEHLDPAYDQRSHDDLEVNVLLDFLNLYFIFRNLANHLYAKVYETQEDMCRKRNEIRVANLQLGVVRSQVRKFDFISLY